MFQARINNTGTGLKLGSDFTRRLFKDFLKKNAGERVRIELVLPESRNQRGFLEGAMIPLITYSQENMDHRNPDDVRKVRGWLHEEFSNEMVVVAGKVKTVAKSTKGRKELKEFMEKVLDFMVEQGYQIDALNPEAYKKWRDEIRPFEGGPDNYIDYLLEIGGLK